MSDPVESLILDLLDWIGPDGRPYTEVLDAWRTSCPRLPVWEDANQRGLLTQQLDSARGRLVLVSRAGWSHVRAHHLAGDDAGPEAEAPRGEQPIG
jgi:hypothetical protein